MNLFKPISICDNNKTIKMQKYIKISLKKNRLQLRIILLYNVSLYPYGNNVSRLVLFKLHQEVMVISWNMALICQQT